MFVLNIGLVSLACKW